MSNLDTFQNKINLIQKARERHSKTLDKIDAYVLDSISGKSKVLTIEKYKQTSILFSDMLLAVNINGELSHLIELFSIVDYAMKNVRPDPLPICEEVVRMITKKNMVIYKKCNLILDKQHYDDSIYQEAFHIIEDWYADLVYIQAIMTGDLTKQ